MKSKCHTLDRNDMRAQRDICGAGAELVDQAIEAMFKIKYHPWVQDSKVNDCIN